MGEKHWLIASVKAIPFGDKMGHAFLYGVLSFLLNYALVFKQIKNTKLFLGSTLILIFAFAEEITQIWIPSRTFDWIDLAADVVGITLFAYLSTWYSKKFITRHRSNK